MSYIDNIQLVNSATGKPFVLTLDRLIICQKNNNSSGCKLLYKDDTNEFRLIPITAVPSAIFSSAKLIALTEKITGDILYINPNVITTVENNVKGEVGSTIKLNFYSSLWPVNIYNVNETQVVIKNYINVLDVNNKVKIDFSDTTAGFLIDKLVAGTNVVLTPSPSGNKTLTIDVIGSSITALTDYAELYSLATGALLDEGNWYSVPDTYNTIGGTLYVFAPKNNTIYELGYFLQDTISDEVDSVKVDISQSSENNAIIYREDKRSNRIFGNDNIKNFVWGNDNYKNNFVDQSSTIVSLSTSILSFVNNKIFNSSVIDAPSATSSISGNTMSNCTLDTTNLGGFFNNNNVFGASISFDIFSIANISNCFILINDSILFINQTYDNKIIHPGFSNFDESVDLSGTSTLNLGVNNNYIGIFTVVSPNPTENINNIINQPFNHDFKIYAESGLALTITGTPLSSSISGDIVLPSPTFIVDGDEESYILLKNKSNIAYQIDTNEYI